MRNPERVLSSLAEHSKASNYQFERLYRILFNEEMFYIAYQRISANKGGMTAGVDGTTTDAMSLPRIEKLIDSLKDESYQPQPARRVYIPKKNGKKRPLGIPSANDKLVQEVVRMDSDLIGVVILHWLKFKRHFAELNGLLKATSKDFSITSTMMY